MIEDSQPALATELNRTDYLDEFSTDSQVIIRLIWDGPEDLCKVLRDGGPISQLRQYLMGRFDWDVIRINNCFNEIRRALG